MSDHPARDDTSAALDAYVRHFRVAVPQDATAHIYERLGRASLEMMERNMRAEITTANECQLAQPTRA